MQRTIFFTSFTALLSTLAIASSASAADANTAKKATTEAAEAPAPATTDEHLRGLEIGLRPTLGSVGASSPIQAAEQATDDVPQPFRRGAAMYGASIGAGLQLGFRFHPLVSAGLRGDLGTVGAKDATDGTTNISRSWQSAGLYARVYPLALNETTRRYIDPWVATGITYVHDGQTFSTPSQANGRSVNVGWQADSHAIGVPIGIGIDYRVTKWLSAGPSFEYVIMNPIAGCVKASIGGPDARTCTDETKGSKGPIAVAEGAWNAGISVRVTPF